LLLNEGEEFMGLGVVGVEADGFADVGDGVGGAAGHEDGHVEVVVGFGEAWAIGDHRSRTIQFPIRA